MKKLVLTGGGTGGHIYPALAIGDEFINRYGGEVIYIGSKTGLENKIVANKPGYKFIGLDTMGINQKNPFKMVKGLYKYVMAQRVAKKILQDEKPDIVLGTGGYVAAPVIKVASNLGIKTIIHEQNSMPGKANLHLARKVDYVATSFAAANQSFKGANVVLTGNPLTTTATKIKPIKKDTKNNIDLTKKTVLITSGSRGAMGVNMPLIKKYQELSKKDYQIIHVTGSRDYEVCKKENKGYSNIHTIEYIDNLSTYIASVDLLVSRCGASTIAEIEGIKVPSILIPSPYVANKHQHVNAKELVDIKAAFILEDDQIEQELVGLIDKIINDDKLIKEMKNNIKQTNKENALEEIFKLM